MVCYLFFYMFCSIISLFLQQIARILVNNQDDLVNGKFGVSGPLLPCFFFGGRFRLQKTRSSGVASSKDALAAYADVGEVWMGHVDHPSTVEPERPLGERNYNDLFLPVGHLQWWVSKGIPPKKNPLNSGFRNYTSLPRLCCGCLF